LEEPAVVEIHGQKAWRAFFGGDSLSDLNSEGSKSKALNRFLGVPEKKRWERPVTAHHEIELRGFFQVWREPSYRATFCRYGCGVSFKTLGGIKIDPVQWMFVVAEVKYGNLKVKPYDIEVNLGGMRLNGGMGFRF